MLSVFTYSTYIQVHFSLDLFMEAYNMNTYQTAHMTIMTHSLPFSFGCLLPECPIVKYWTGK